MTTEVLAAPIASKTSRRINSAFWLALPAVLLVVVFLIVPYLNIVLMSFRTPSTTAPYGPGFTVANYYRAITDSFYFAVLLRTLIVTFTVTLVCFLLGFPVAYHLARMTSKWRTFFYALVLAPLLVSAVIRSFGWMIILSNSGLINSILRDFGLITRPLPLMYNEFGVIVGLVHVNIPFMILPLLAALQGIGPSLEEAAHSLGAKRMTVLRRIVLPLAMPGIQSGAILVFVMATGSYVTPILLGGSRVQLMTPMVVQQLSDAFLWPFGSALAIVLAAIGGLVIFAWARPTQKLINRMGRR
ncbi:ABC transporter permease [Acuticoccus kandeliae]|uniref:ABC transporter permease n=1 Tax=Acuticoccus kandeliae TaxID=2073160 RepID=UPI00196A6E0D|nr:ABC transporter permease [Acuticoccus kandeliae]